MNVVDLVPEFLRMVREARTPIDYMARFWGWLDAQRSGALAPLLSDMVRLWSGIGSSLDLPEARAVAGKLEAIDDADRLARVSSAIARFATVAGSEPDGDVVLLAGLRRPEGYSRFDRGRNTVFLGLDHPSSLAHEDHLPLILAHELTHAVRDPSPDVLGDYGGWMTMSHDDFVARHPFREHLVSEGLATAVSELAWPGKPEARYVFMDQADHAWCRAHHREIAERMLRALADDEDYHTFYARGSVTPESPDCCDYYFGLCLGRYALAREAAGVLLRLPATTLLQRFLDDFVVAFVGTEVAVPYRGATEPATASAPVAPIDPCVLPPLVRRFHADLSAEVAAHPTAAARDAIALNEAVAGERLEHGGAPYDVWPSPVALSPECVLYLRWVAERVLGTIEKVVGLYQEDPELRAYFGFPEHLDRLARLDPGYRPLVPLGRFDAFWNGKTVRYLELNTNGTAAIALADRLGELYLRLPHAAASAQRHRTTTLPIVAPLLDTLRECWRQAAPDGRGEAPPRIAIVDWRDLPTASELALLADHLVAAGMPAMVVDPEELHYDGTRLLGRGAPIDVVYRRLTLVDVLERADRLQPLLAASLEHRVVTVGPFAADVAHSKRMFAVLTHERWRPCFSMEERALIDAHVPWTRMFRPGPTLWGGHGRELRELALAEQTRFVLKPAEGHEGRDVVLGVEVSAAEWEREIAWRYGGDHVLQERVEAPVREVLVPGPHGFTLEPRHLHLGEFMFGGRLVGFLARASTSLVLSARSDDRALPVLVLGGAERDELGSELAHP